jgi:hypothetical protein
VARTHQVEPETAAQRLGPLEDFDRGPFAGGDERLDLGDALPVYVEVLETAVKKVGLTGIGVVDEGQKTA